MSNQATDHKMEDTEMAESPAAAEKGKGKGKAVQADPMEESEDSESEASGVEDEVRYLPTESLCATA